jgi:1-acyl-sn-glycerol-3-phosphate acyltransferase
MHQVIVEKPYKFIAPYRRTDWSWFIRKFSLHAVWLRRKHGVVDYEVRHLERFRASLAAGHGILVTPNHSRTCDPMVIGWLAKEAPCYLYSMASWHLFNEGWFSAWAIHKMGGFSVNREGIDRQSINAAIEMLVEAQRPLVIFPEGTTTRTNDRLHALLDGVAFIARAAAKKRAKEAEGKKVVVHPVALKYRFQDDLAKAIDPALAEIESRFSWNSQRGKPLMERVTNIGQALLALKEIEYFGAPREGTFSERQACLVDRLLAPLEEEWLGARQGGPVVPRVKGLRMKLAPEMVAGSLTPLERDRRLRQLSDIYLAQQISFYPEDYLAAHPSVDRLLETVERFEEDLTDHARVHGRLKVILEVGEPIEVDRERDRKAEVDPLMKQIEVSLQAMLDRLALESPLCETE